MHAAAASQTGIIGARGRGSRQEHSAMAQVTEAYFPIRRLDRWPSLDLFDEDDHLLFGKSAFLIAIILQVDHLHWIYAGASGSGQISN